MTVYYNYYYNSMTEKVLKKYTKYINISIVCFFINIIIKNTMYKTLHY